MSKTIMVVDDSMSVRRVVSTALTAVGFKVIQGRDGQHALDQLKNGIEVDLIVSDINMPRMNGLEFVKLAKMLPNCKYTPVIMLTTESGDDIKAKGRQLGVRAWLVKPFQGDQMLAAVKKLIPG